MKISIYQINTERDWDGVVFEGYEKLEDIQGSPNINSALYDTVFEGEVDCKNLEDVYHIFNIDKPEEYRGRSLSVSDIVEIKEAEGTPPGFYYCDNFGFKKVEFEPQLAKPMPELKMKVVLVEPGKLARVAEIGSDLESMQAAVGGYIEATYPYAEEVAIICNEEGKITGLPLNRAIYVNGRDGQEMIDIIAGSFFICDCSTEEFRSLSEEQLKRYTEKFKNPERFIRTDEGITAIPYAPTVSDREYY